MIVVVAVLCDIEECLEGESSVSLNRWWKEGMSWYVGGVIDFVTGAVLHFDELRWLVEC